MSIEEKEKSAKEEDVMTVTDESRRTQMEVDADTPISAWGVISFALISGIMVLAIATTLGRDFVTGGLSSPAPPL